MSDSKKLDPDLMVPSWKECPRGCRQGMVLEIVPYDPPGKIEWLPSVPSGRYRCQDCNEYEDVSV